MRYYFLLVLYLVLALINIGFILHFYPAPATNFEATLDFYVDGELVEPPLTTSYWSDKKTTIGNVEEGLRHYTIVKRLIERSA